MTTFPLERARFHLPLRDRAEAGRLLAHRLTRYADDPRVVVLALPRGGVPVAREVSLALHAPLDVFLVRKLGTPGHRELAMGALASGNVRVLNRDIVRGLAISAEQIDDVTRREAAELRRRETLYRKDLPPLDVRGKTVIVVDDGVATGATMRAGIHALRQLEPVRIVLAIAVAPPDALHLLESAADEVVCLATPEPFRAISLHYDDFSQVSDEEVHAVLEEVRTTAR